MTIIHIALTNCCCFLTSIQISQETGKVVWYSHFFKNFPHFVVIYIVNGFSTVNEAKVGVFWNSLAFSMIQWMLAIWFLLPLPFLNPAWTSVSSRLTLDIHLSCSYKISCDPSLSLVRQHKLSWPNFICLIGLVDQTVVNLTKVADEIWVST